MIEEIKKIDKESFFKPEPKRKVSILEKFFYILGYKK